MLFCPCVCGLFVIAHDGSIVNTENVSYFPCLTVNVLKYFSACFVSGLIAIL